MEKLKSNKIITTIGIIMAIIIAVVSIFFAKETIFLNENAKNLENQAATIATTNGSFGLDSTEIIKKASELLGKGYKFGLKGYNGNLYTTNYNSSKLYSANQIGVTTDKPANNDGIDCSGLIYWTLAQLGCSTQNFTVLQNPVPVDTLHWVSYSGSPSITAHGVTSKINILKNNESITNDLRYYEYMEGNTKKTLPAGTILVSISSGEAYNHSWICLGDLGTTNPEEVKTLLNNMGITNIPEGTVFASNNYCTYWRIEAAGGNVNKVVINNADPNEKDNDGGKTTGKIYAFQIANEITGEYKLNIQKVDSNGNPINVGSMSNIFEATLNNEKINLSRISPNEFTTNSINITASTVDSQDIIIIKEANAPVGYEKYGKEIKLVIEKIIDTDENGKVQYEGNISEVYIDGVKHTQEHGGWKYDNGNVCIESNDGKITVKIKNSKVDLALKKTITKVTHNDETKDVTTENGFNVGRDESKFVINTANLKNNSTTNAIYNMNKTPVEVQKGDIVEYSIRIYNEGEVAAKALDINDYIPVGLEVQKVYYKTTEITQTSETIDNTDLVNENYYKYDKEHGVLNVHLGAANLINAYNKQLDRLSNDYITVTCKVADEATGVLTNVAEIRNYETETGIISTDIDSTSDNWNSPNGDGRTNTDKSTEAWRNYSNEQQTYLDGDWHPFVAQDAGVNGNKGDDDDFDKLIVKNEYTVNIKKVDGSDNSISDIQFDIIRKKSSEETILEDDTMISENGFTYKDVVSSTDANIYYEITELPNSNYIQLDETMYFDLKVENGSIVSYKFNYGSNESNTYVTDASKTYTCTSNVKNIQLDVVVEFTPTSINVKIENIKPVEGSYGIKINKVSSGNNEALGGVTFEVASSFGTAFGDEVGNVETIERTTNDEGIVTIVEDKKINLESYQWIDQYTIKEIGTKENYTALGTDIIIQAYKSIDKNGKYILTNWFVMPKGSNIFATTNIITGKSSNNSINIKNNGVLFTITATEEVINGETVISLTITNAPDNVVPLQIRKVSEKDGTTVITGTDFTITRGEIELFDGIDETGTIVLEDNVEASASVVRYKIVENSAADGYDNVLKDKYIMLAVKLANGVPSEVVAKVYNNSDNMEDTDLTSKVSASIVDVNSVPTIDLQIQNPESTKVIDLALKKVITEVNGIEVKTSNGFDEDFDRLTTGDDKVRIDTTPLQNGKYDAEYYLNKTPVLVQKGAKVKYQIRIYNEGTQEPATASIITDYLPEGLKVENAYYKNNTTPLTKGIDYIYNEENKVLVVNVLGNKDLIPVYDGGENLSFDYITVECTVLDTAEGILTNVAEISEYKTTVGSVNEDRDSWQDNWQNPNDGKSENNETTDRTTLDWVDYAGDEDNVIEDGKYNNYIGQEDDDDFEKIVVGEIDLVLKKIITKINDTSVNDLEISFQRFENGKVTINPESMNKNENVTTAEYYLNKTPIKVKINDEVTYEIRIYNEGTIDATASQITDYIPKGLQFVSASYNGAALVEGTNYTIENNVLKISAMKNNLIDRYTGNENNATVEPSYDVVTVTCKVDGSIRGLLTNVAEISEYQTIVGTTTIDRDSQTVGNGEWQAPEGSNKTTLDGKSGSAWAYYRTDESTYGKFLNWAGQQDDDDFEKVLVTNGYTLQLQKISGFDNSKGIENVEFDINGTSYVTDENGLTNQTSITELEDVLSLDTYVIKEVSTNSNYVKLQNPIHLAVIKKSTSVGYTTISGFMVNFEDGNFDSAQTKQVTNMVFKNGIYTKTYHTYDEQGNLVDVIITITEDKVNIGDFKITITLENTIPNNMYNLYIKKVDETGKTIDDVKFKVKGFTDISFEKETVTSGELTYITTQYINENNYAKTDIYEIEEIETLSQYIKLEDVLTLEVNKKISEDNLEYEIDTMKLVYNGKESTEGKEITLSDIPVGNDGRTIDITAKLVRQENAQTGEMENAIIVTIPNEKNPGEYTVLIRKVNAENKEPLSGAKFSIKEANSTGAGYETEFTDNQGVAVLLQSIKILNEQTQVYTITETQVPDRYELYEGEVTLTVVTKLGENGYVLDKENIKVEGGNATINVENSTITITMPNREKEFDLALRKFITKVNDTEFTGENSREPVVNVATLINGDSSKNGEKTATYTHSKEPVLVSPTDIVEYTIRVYNEGEINGYASQVMDDIPEGVEMITPTYDEQGNATNFNAEYRWKMYKEMKETENAENYIYYNNKYYVETNNSQEAELIVTDYLSKANGEKLLEMAGVSQTEQNPNLIKAFNAEKSELDYRDVKVQFKVKSTNAEDVIITNYAQITEDTDENEEDVVDRDSTPNTWVENEDDQDVEHIKVRYFDLALYKWVTTTVVTEDGKTVEFDSKHTQDDKSNVVNVSIPKDKLEDVVVKFKYQIKVENQGQLEGYAKEVKDHVPAGLKFVQEDNVDFGWKLQEDGTITTDYLKDTLLKPGESAEVTVVLTWINGEDNLGKKVNFAEISEDYNEYDDTPDVDSTPNNFKDTPDEDDEDLDEVMLQVKTGVNDGMTYLILGIAVMMIICGGIVGIKKFVLKT